MSEHTPTPWFVHDFTEVPGFTDPLPVDVTISCDHPATITVANVDRGMTATLEEARANAAFIVHAVNLHDEMVEALKAADRYFTRFHEAVGRGPVSVMTANKIRSALSKATQTQAGG